MRQAGSRLIDYATQNYGFSDNLLVPCDRRIGLASPAVSNDGRNTGNTSGTVSRDEHGVSLILAAAELDALSASSLALSMATSDSAAEVTADRGAQPQSPLFMPVGDSDLDEFEQEEEAWEGEPEQGEVASEEDLFGHDGVVECEAGEEEVASEDDVPAETVPVRKIPERRPVAKRLRVLYRESLRIRARNGRLVTPFRSRSRRYQ